MLPQIAAAKAAAMAATGQLYGERIRYDGEGDSVEIPAAVPLAPEARINTEAEVAFQTVELEWRLTAAAIVLNGQIVEPAAGHRITCIERDPEETYEIIHDDDEACWRRVDGQGITIRVLTKRVRTA